MATANDIRAKRMRLEVLEKTIPQSQDRLERMIKEKAGLEAVINRIESHDLGKKHTGLCGEPYPRSGDDAISDPLPDCERFYSHTGPHSWEGGGVG